MNAGTVFYLLKNRMLVEIRKAGSNTAGHVKGHGNGQIIAGKRVSDHSPGCFLLHGPFFGHLC